jgi:sensor c-di-GMP phosphodiesterase-like protein
MDENSVLYLEQCRYTEHSVYVAIQNEQKYSTISALFWDIMQHLVVYSLRTFRENLSAPSSRAKKSKKIRCPETSVRNNNPEERVSLRRKPKITKGVWNSIASCSNASFRSSWTSWTNTKIFVIVAGTLCFVVISNLLVYLNIFFLNFPENRNVCVTTGGVYRNRHR